MRLSITACLSAALLLLGSGAGGQEPLESPAPVGRPLQVIPGTAQADTPTIPGYQGTVPRSNEVWPYQMFDPNCSAGNEPVFLYSADTLLWTLRPAVDQPLALRVRDDSVAFNTGAQDYGFEPGVRIRASYNTEENTSFEAEYFGVYTWQASNSVFDNGPGLRLPGDLGQPQYSLNYSTSAPGLIFPGNPQYSTQAYQMSFLAEASMNSIEANIAFGEKKSEVKYLFGLRYLKFDERFAITSYSNVSTYGPAPGNVLLGTEPQVSHYLIDTRNDAIGINLGARFRRHYCSGMKLEMVGKVAVLDNNARQAQFVGDQNDRVTVRATGGERAVAALISEYNFSAVFPINTVWGFRTGYDVVWMTGIARATDQLNFSVNNLAGEGVRIREGGFMHGLHLGLEAEW